MADNLKPRLPCRDGWLLPVLQPLVPHMLQRLTAAWSTVLSNQALRPAHQEGDPHASATAEDSDAANDDVVMERLLRELTREHLTLLVQLQEQRPASGGGGDFSCPRYRRCCLDGSQPCQVAGSLLAASACLRKSEILRLVGNSDHLRCCSCSCRSRHLF